VRLTWVPPQGCKIGSLNFDRAEDAFPVDFFSYAELRQFVRGAVTDGDRPILEDNFICGALGAFKNFLRRFRAAQVNRAHFAPEMEGTVGRPKRS